MRNKRTNQAISSGFCITRASLGDARATVLLAPTLYLVASLTVDGISLNEARGEGGATGAAAAALFACGVLLRLASLLVAWTFVFTSVREERRKLAERHARLRFVADACKLEDDADAEEGAARAAAERVVRNVATHMPRAAAGMSAGSMAVSSAILAESAAAAAAGEARGDEELGSERAKSALLRGFSGAVSAYVLVVAAAALFSLVSEEWLVTMAAVQDAALWAFTASLAWLLRPRDEKCVRRFAHARCLPKLWTKN